MRSLSAIAAGDGLRAGLDRLPAPADDARLRLKPLAMALHVALAATLAAGASGVVHAQGSEAGVAVRQYDIPPGLLVDAVSRYAQQAGVAIVVDTHVLGRLRSAGLSGRYGVDEGFRRLLQGSGYAAVKSEAGYLLVPAASVARGAGTTSLEAVMVTATAIPPESSNTLQSSSRVARLAGPVQRLPQVVNVVPQELLQQQQVTTLEQALHNVPGITLTIGEGTGGPNGDQFRIRGLEAKGDAYIDGLRDFGVYVRDTFNTEQVEVLKGPSSENFGMGTSGGAINSQTKLARLENAASVEASVGTGPLSRFTGDINRQLNDTTALRINLMQHRQDVVDRDGVKSNRWGFAASLGIGLETDSSWYLNYVHQSNDRTPDFGQPLIGRSATEVRRPVAEYGVDRANYYGKDTDRDRSSADLLTSLFSHRLSDTTTLSNETRLGYYERRFSATVASCTQACADVFFAGGNPEVSYGAGGGPSYFQRSQGLQNITTLSTKFDTGGIAHEARLGFDIGYQSDYRLAYAYRSTVTGDFGNHKTPPGLLTPDTSSANYIEEVNPAATNNIKRSSQIDLAAFASDRVQFSPAWSVLGSLRWDYFHQRYRLEGSADSGGTLTEATPSFFSPKLSLIWEPGSQQTYYLSYGWASTFPFGGYISADTYPINASRKNLDPEKTRTLELGGKISLLDGQLGLSGALFRTTKNNTYYDSGAGIVTSTGDAQRTSGVELGLSGQLTPRWKLYLGYTYLDSEILDSTVTTNIGNPVQGVARNSGSLWTSYTLALWPVLPGQLTIGGGASYRDSMYIRSDKMAELPYSLSYDATVSYEYANLRFTLTGYNLADRTNYDNFFFGGSPDAARATPTSGRSFVLSLRAFF